MVSTRTNEMLADYLPEPSIGLIADLLLKYHCTLRICRPRFTKHGDYRAPFKDKGHRISVNGSLTKHAFLMTLLHEIAHLQVWENYKRRVKPHGKEWQLAFRQLLTGFAQEPFFPKNICQEIHHCYINSIKASNAAKDALENLLNRDDETDDISVADIPFDTIFQLKSGKKFVKLKKLRSRYQCKSVDNGRIYTVHPNAKVSLTKFEVRG